MKKTQLTDALRNIRKRIVSYLSICLVVMLGVGAFLCTRYMETGIIREAAGYYRDRNFKDFELISSLGASDKSIEAIKAVDGVVDAEGVMEYEGSLQKGEFKKNVTVLSRTDRVSVPQLIDGRLPSASNECAIGEDFSEESGIKTGDTVTIYLTSSGDDDPLHGHQYTVSGLIKHPDYVHRKLTSTVILPVSAFDMSVTDDAYMRVFVRANDVALDDTFTQTYFDETAGTKKALEDLTEKLSTDRAGEVRVEAYSKIDEEWEKALAELEDAENDIADSEAELASKLKSGRKELKDAEKTLASELAEANRKIRKGELTIKNYEKKLAKAKAELKEYRAAYNEAKELKDLFKDEDNWVEGALEDVNTLLAYQEDPAAHPEVDQRAVELDLAQKLIDQKDNIQALIDYSKTDEAMEDAKKLEDLTGKPVVLYVKLLRLTDADKLLSSATNVMENEDAHFSKEELEIMKEVFEAILQVRSEFDDAEKTLDDSEKQISKGAATLKQKKGELKAAKRQLNAEKNSAEKKIRDGWSKYYSMKASYESKLEEAKALLAENREEAEKKLAEAKADVGEIDCDWIVLDRNANAGYVDVKVQLDSLRSTGMVFGVLFILITALVCFSTLTIIIEEQKKLIGTVKAFGFHKSEVLNKYLIFGLSAGILGDILAVFTGYCLSEIVQTVYSASNLYQYGRPASIMRPVPTILISLAMLLVCAVASILACSEVLRRPASALMSGQSLRKSTRKTVSSGRKGSLYSKLILRNIRDDKARVIVSTAIVAFCCMLIGVGLSFKLATTGMLAKQEGDINRFDIRMDMGSSVTDEQRAEMIALLDAKGVDHTEAVYQSCLFNTGSTITGMTMLAGDPDVLNKYFGMDSTDIRSELTSDGVIIPVRMSENYGYTAGDTVSVLDSAMQKHDAPVTGTYTCYFGRTVVTTPEGYRKIFEDEFDPNSSFMHLNGADAQALKKELLAINDDISFEGKSDFRTSFESVGALYNIIVYVTMGVALFMSFMILTNLANIFLTRKKNELIVMRVNGFSVKQTKGYLTREAVLTTVVGLAVGVLVGSLLTPYAVRILEPADLQFDRSYHSISWIIAGGIEGLFALIIYSTVFRRVKHFNLKDIAS